MDESGNGRDPEQRLQHAADELDHRLHQLEDHIQDADEKAQARRDESEASRTVTGDREETGPGPPSGEDPKGTVDEP
jgi:hypothetical protein